MCFRPQAQICLSGFFVIGLKYNYSMLMSKNIKYFVVLFNNNSSLYIQMKSTVSPDHYHAKCSWWTKQKARCGLKVVSLNWSICFGLLSAICEAVSIKQAIVWIVKFCQGIIQKIRTFKITTFWPTHPPCTRKYTFDHTSLHGRTNVFCSLQQMMNELGT